MKSTLQKPSSSKSIDEAAIIARGYVTCEEWDILAAANKIRKISTKCPGCDRNERFFVYSLDSAPNQVILANDLTFYKNLPTAGLIGMLKTDGDLDVEDAQKRWGIIGPAFIEYLQGCIKNPSLASTAALLLGNTSSGTVRFVPRHNS